MVPASMSHFSQTTSSGSMAAHDRTRALSLKMIGSCMTILAMLVERLDKKSLFCSLYDIYQTRGVIDLVSQEHRRG